MKCAKCGERISYNSYKKVKGKYYCLDCKLETQVEEAAKEIQKYGIVGFTSETEKPVKVIKRKKKTRKHKKVN